MKRLLVLFLLIITPLAEAGKVFRDQNFKLEPLLTDSTLAISAELGGLITSGNKDSTSILGSITTKYEWAKWRHKYQLKFYYKEDEKDNNEVQTTAEKYLLNAEAYYSFTSRDSVLAFFGSDHDRFGSYRHLTSLGAGYNVRLIEGSLMVVDAYIAPGYTFSETRDGTTESAPILRTSGSVEWLMNSNTKFIQKLSLESSSINTRFISDSAITAKLHGSMQMKVGFKMTSDAEVQPGRKHTDTEMSVTLVVNF